MKAVRNQSQERADFSTSLARIVSELDSPASPLTLILHEWYGTNNAEWKIQPTVLLMVFDGE